MRTLSEQRGGPAGVVAGGGEAGSVDTSGGSSGAVSVGERVSVGEDEHGGVEVAGWRGGEPRLAGSAAGSVGVVRRLSLRVQSSSHVVGAGVWSTSCGAERSAWVHAGRGVASSTKISRDTNTLRVEGRKHR